MSSPTKFVLDSWALIAYISGEEPAATRVNQLLHLGLQESATLYLSAINLGEIYYTLGRRMGESKAKSYLILLKKLPIEILPATEPAILLASELKMRHPIAYADAFALASAQDLAAVLVTGDPELFALENEVLIERLHRED